MLNLGGTVKARDLSALWNAVFQLQGLSALSGHKEAENGKEPHRVLMTPGRFMLMRHLHTVIT